MGKTSEQELEALDRENDGHAAGTSRHWVVNAARAIARAFVRYHPVLIALTAFILRFVLILHEYSVPSSDTMSHHLFDYEAGNIARSITEGRGFSSPFAGSTGPTAWMGPIYVYLCAAVFKLFGVFTQLSEVVLLSLNSVFSALTALVIYLIGTKISKRSVGLLGGWLWAILPQSLILSTTLIWETALSALLVALAVLFAIELSTRSNLRRWIGFGVFWGLVALTNPALLSIFAVSLTWIILRHRNQDTYVRGAALAILVCVITISPWLVRNRVIFGQWVFIRSNFGFEFYLGSYELAHGTSGLSQHPRVDPTEYQKYKSMGEIAYVNFHTKEALSYARQHPGLFLRKTGSNFALFWARGISRSRDLLGTLLSMLCFLGFSLAALRREREWFLCAAILLIYPLPYCITFTAIRYRHPIEPLMVALSAFLLASIRREKTLARVQDEGT